jgi:hypothetical protein
MAGKGARYMYQAAVIYAPASPEMDALTERIARELGQQSLKVVRKEAAQAIVPDLTAADLVLLGCAPQDRAPIHQDFAEILRALGGMSLAGRTIGLFAVGDAGTLQAFEKALADCEVPVPARQCLNLPSASLPSADLVPWLTTLTERLGQLESK